MKTSCIATKNSLMKWTEALWNSESRSDVSKENIVYSRETILSTT